MTSLTSDDIVHVLEFISHVPILVQSPPVESLDMDNSAYALFIEKTLGAITPIIATATSAIMNTDFNNIFNYA